MTKLDIDFGGSACIARCEHCRFGMADVPSLETFSDESLTLLNRLIDFSAKRKDAIRLSYMSPFSRMSELPAINQNIDTVSVAFSSIEEIEANKGEILQRLEQFNGVAIELSLNHHPISRFNIEEHLPPIVSIQHALFALLPNLREVYLGLNHNTSAETVEDLKKETLFATYAYAEGVGRIFRDEDFGDSQIVVTGQGDAIFTRAIVRFGQRQFAFGCRYLLAHDVKEEARSEHLVTVNDKLCLALLNSGVHIGHSTYAINNPLYWFTHEDFGKLVDTALTSSLSLYEVCSAALSKRQKLAIQK